MAALMATDEFVFAITPEPVTQVVRIDRAQYEVVREAILENLRLHGPITFVKLGDLVEDQLQRDFDGLVMWYYTMVKLDMEACGEIHCVPGSKPQMIELA